MVISSFHPSWRDISDEITAFDDGLDTVAVQEDIVGRFKAVKPSTKAKQSFEAQVDNIIKAKATRLANRPAHAYVRFPLLTTFFPFRLIREGYLDLQAAGSSTVTRQGIVRRRTGRSAFAQGQRRNPGRFLRCVAHLDQGKRSP
jgi:hypothetical protein